MSPIVGAETPLPGARQIALRALTSPWSLTAILVLTLNDHVLKDAFPGWLTGKLSDFAGMVFFPLLIAVVVSARRAGSWERPLWTGVVLTGVLFAAIKLIPPAASGVEWVMDTVGIPWRITVDPTDLVALPFLAAPIAIWRRSIEEWRPRDRRRFEAIVVLVAVAATMATSCDDAYPAVWAVEARDDVLLAYVESRAFRSIDGGETWVVIEVEPDGAPSRSESQTTGCFEDDPDHCFHLVSPLTVEESRPGGERTTAFHVSAERVDYMERTYGEACSDYAVDVTDIAISDGDQPVVLVAANDSGVLLRHHDGSWERGVLPEWTVAPEADIGQGATFPISASWGVGLFFSMVVASVGSRRLVPGHGTRDGFWWGAARFVGVFGAMGVALLGSGYFGALIGGILALGMIPAGLGYGRLASWLGQSLEDRRWMRFMSIALIPLGSALLAFIVWLLWRTAVIESYDVAQSMAMLVLFVGVVTSLGLVFALQPPVNFRALPTAPTSAVGRDQIGAVTAQFRRSTVVGCAGTIAWIVALGGISGAPAIGVTAGLSAVLALGYVAWHSSQSVATRLTLTALPLLSVGVLVVAGLSILNFGLLAVLAYSASAASMVPARRGGAPRRLRRLAILLISVPVTFLGGVVGAMNFLAPSLLMPLMFLTAVLFAEDRPAPVTEQGSDD